MAKPELIAQLGLFILHHINIQIHQIILRLNDPMTKIFNLLLVPSLQHKLLHPQQHGEDPLGVWQAMVGQGLHQARVHHAEGVSKTL